MRYSVVRFAAGCIGSLFSVVCAYAHTEAQTNELIHSMLRRSLLRPNFDAQTQVFKTMPSITSSQTEFFAPWDGWTEEEKRSVFDWYLSHLSTTAISRGMVAGRYWADNPMAGAAIAQCEAMAYTNALPALLENVTNSFDSSRCSSIRLALKWSPLDGSLAGLVCGIVTNEQKYTREERNLAYRAYCDKIIEQTSDLDAVKSCADAIFVCRDDPIGAVALDKMLVVVKPGYSNSEERCACALSVLANENSSASCLRYFEAVTNTIGSVSRAEWQGNGPIGGAGVAE